MRDVERSLQEGMKTSMEGLFCLSRDGRVCQLGVRNTLAFADDEVRRGDSGQSGLPKPG
jgi:hypothetical protein